MLPSFLRNQTKSPFKYGSKGLSKEQFKIIRNLGEGKFGTVSLARQLYTGKYVSMQVYMLIQRYDSGIEEDEQEEHSSRQFTNPIHQITKDPNIFRPSKYNKNLWFFCR